MTCTGRKLSTEVSIPFKVTIIDIVILMQNLIVVTANGEKNIHRKEKKRNAMSLRSGFLILPMQNSKWQ